MGFVDFTSWLFGLAFGSDENYEVAEHHRRLAEGARSDALAPELLADPDDRTSNPLAAYLEDDEQPHYLFHGTRLLIEDAAGSLDRNHPTRQLVVLVSDQRLLFVLGGRMADDLYEVPLSAVTAIYVDEDDPYRHIVVAADRDNDEMTFFADVTIESHHDALDKGVEYVRGHS